MQFIALDIRTLSFIATSISFLFSLGLFAFNHFQKAYKGFGLFAAAAALFAGGFFFLGFRDILSDFITITVANLMLILAMVFYYEGVRRFLKHKPGFHPLSILSIAAGIFIFLYYTFYQPSVNTRIIGIAAIYFILSGLSAWELIRSGQQGTWRVPDIVTALIFLGFSLFHIFRVIYTIKESPIQSFMSAGTVHGLAFVFVILLVAGTTFGFIWMVTKRYEHELVKLATTDALTNILNRRGVESLAEKEITRMLRKGTCLALVLCDIDQFKDINDQHGHETGDKILIKFADALHRNSRSIDILGRLGGDEFILILPETSLNQALQIAERLREHIESTAFEIHEKRLEVTASFGITATDKNLWPLHDLISYADQALYQSKHGGRNRVTVLQKEMLS